MSNHATDAHHAGASPDHVPHVLPLKVYFGVFAMLIVFTVLTVAVSYVDLGTTVNLVVALLVAGAKALMVATIFMHLAFDKKFNAIIIASSVLFLFVLVGITMADTETRGRYGGPTFVSSDRPVDPAQPFGENARQSEQKLIEKWTPKQAPAAE